MIQRWKQWVNRLSVKKKMIFYGYLILAPTMIVICTGLLFYNYFKARDEKLDSDQNNINILAENIYILQTDIKEFSTYICINNEVQQILQSENVQQLNTDSRLWLEDAPMQIIQDMMSLKGYIKTIAIYPENGVTPYLRCLDDSAYIEDMAAVRKTDSYRQTLESEKKILWTRVDKDDEDAYSSNHSIKIVLHREMYDLTKKESLGYIVIGISQEKFIELCNSIIQSEDEGVLIMDKQGGELARTGIIPEEIESYLKSSDFIEQDYQERESIISYGSYNIICSQKDKNASIVCKIRPAYNLGMLIVDVAHIPVILVIGLLAGLMPFLVVISNIVTKPLEKVTEAIVKFSAGDFEQKVEVETEDELGEVAHCFNRMVEDIKTLIDSNYVITIKEKESELAVLQAQINPHFLYNTLDTLYWQAMDEDSEEIAESILALSQLFRLVLSQGNKEVSVSQEMELIARYLQIQKMRFFKRLDYTIELDEQLGDMMIPKLILQPFVENAIVHGFENVSTPCHLSVSGKKDKDKMSFVIKDTGVGMTKEQIARIWEEESAEYARQRIGRYAIKNVRERLELKYHDDFTLEITSEIGKGTTVLLVLPCAEESKE